MPRQVVLVQELDQFDVETIPSPYADEYSRLDDDFVTNICTKGIIVPVIAVQHNDKLVVIDGHRRIMAARECQKRGIHLPVPVRQLQIDLSNPNDALMARIYAFTLNRFAAGRDDDMFIRNRDEIIEDLVLRIIETGHEFAESLARDSVPNELARLIGQTFGVTTVTAANWVRRVLNNSEVVRHKLAEYMARNPPSPPPTHTAVQSLQTSVSSTVVEVGRRYVVEAPRREEERQTQQQQAPRQTSLIQREQLPTADVIFCGHNAVSREKFAVLASTTFGPMLRDMCNHGVLNSEMLNELVDAYQDCGIPCVYNAVVKRWPVSGMYTLKMPAALPQLIKSLAEENRILFTDLSYIATQFLLNFLLLVSYSDKFDTFLNMSRQINMMMITNKFDEAKNLLKSLVNEL
jgi:hypothetical protein